MFNGRTKADQTSKRYFTAAPGEKTQPLAAFEKG
jgi:hypothetical protein